MAKCPKCPNPNYTQGKACSICGHIEKSFGASRNVYKGTTGSLDPDFSS